MHYFMPADVWEETDAVRHHPEAFQKAGHHALIVTGKHSSRANGSLDDVVETLKKCGIPVSVFDAVTENPPVGVIMEAASEGKREGVDFVIGIGGGSPMDAAKAVALMIAHPDRDASYLYEKGQDASHLPLVLIPTTCGTGSEVTPVSVLTRTTAEGKMKGSIPYKIFADTALIDGKYLAFAPDRVIRNTAVDALAHLWESALNRDATTYSVMVAEAGLHAWRDNRALLKKESPSLTDDERLRLMHASTLAGMAIAQTGTSIPHALSYTATTDAGFAHGRAVGYFQAGYLAAADEDTRKNLLRAAGFSSLQAYEDFFREVCGEEKLPAEILEKAVDAVMHTPAKLEKAPFQVDRETLRKIAFFMD